MAKYIRVVEFYGLPGCGKTTLKDIMVSSPVINAGSIHDLLHFFIKEKVLYKLTHLPLKQWCLLSLFLLSLKGRRKNSKKFYIDLYYKVLVYSYFVIKPPYDYIIVDHGLIQQLGSILHNMNYEISDKSLQFFLRFVNSMKNTILVYCRISSTNSLNRIIGRNRSVGRIDAVMNDRQKALFYLEKEYNLFEIFSESANNVYELNMNKTPEELACEMYSLLRK